MSRILDGIDPSCYCLMSRNDYSEIYSNNASEHLQPLFYQISARKGFGEKKNIWRFRYGSRFVRYRNAIASIWNTYKFLTDHRIDAIIACSGDLYDIPMAFVLSIMAQIPFYAYIFDDYVFQWTGWRRKFARAIALIAFRYSKQIIVPNEFLKIEYERRYDSHPVLIHNVCSLEHFNPETSISWPAKKGEINIAYTGAVYHANFDSFMNLVSALEKIERKDIRFHIYSSQHQTGLEEKGITGQNIFFHPHTDHLKIMDIQKRADILFLPLAFDSDIPEVIRTSAPGKLGEYLASGRPILAHAPSDSFVSWYFNTYDCGTIVDNNDPEKLKETIMEIILNPELRRRQSLNAISRALKDFHPDKAQGQFRDLFSLERRIEP